MKIYTQKYTQNIPMTVSEAWDFFSSPRNLQKITPAHMGFKILSEFHQEKMYPGMLITYKVSPVMGIPLDWCTEITHVQDQEYFVDEQRFGPYAMWHHQHHFKAIPGGVAMTDIIDYAIPFGPLGRMMNTILVEKEVKKIFEYRFKKVEELFGVMC